MLISKFHTGPRICRPEYNGPRLDLSEAAHLLPESQYGIDQPGGEREKGGEGEYVQEKLMPQWSTWSWRRGIGGLTARIAPKVVE
ncbi:hypothetical protein JTE90_025200 [Oedothorax gibbosus]|uniref:Uncharacterized protein n=1 Tax=Oedothorax gibbosus TaxID=931172 RepID=A0AAV6UTI9_9ARAC|nr:hypothetical protein JTE90_025200 [Oedothorax gibbosus]